MTQSRVDFSLILFVVSVANFMISCGQEEQSDGRLLLRDQNHSICVKVTK